MERKEEEEEEEGVSIAKISCCNQLNKSIVRGILNSNHFLRSKLF